jgi:hypothetical protein
MFDGVRGNANLIPLITLAAPNEAPFWIRFNKLVKLSFPPLWPDSVGNVAVGWIRFKCPFSCTMPKLCGSFVKLDQRRVVCVPALYRHCKLSSEGEVGMDVWLLQHLSGVIGGA